MDKKTHYRKAFHSPYLGAADVVEPIILTIAYVRLESDKTKKTKDMFNTAYFAEQFIREGEKMKPMILNATNSKTVSRIAGSAFIEDWRDLKVVLFVDPNVRFGKESVEGLRIRAYEAQQQQKPKIPADRFGSAVSQVQRGLQTVDYLCGKYDLTPDQIAQLNAAVGGQHV